MLRNMIKTELKKRKYELSMPYEAIASRANLGISTVKRAFAGEDVTIDTLEKILNALDCDIAFRQNSPASKLYSEQIEKKARFIVSRVIKTSTLEDQTPEEDTTKKMLAKAKKAIAKMPRSKIWI